MRKISNTASLELFMKLFVLALVAKICAVGMVWFLPAEGVSQPIQKNYRPPFVRYSFTAMIQEAAPKEQKASAQTNEASAPGITDMILKGLWGRGKMGSVIVAMKATPKKSEVISVGEVFGGYTLKEVHADHAVFHKNGVDYTLTIQASEKTATLRAQTQAPIVNIDEPVAITKNEIERYAKSPEQIWKEISIIEVRENKKIKGFKVTRIDPKSPFSRLGLQKNDLIIKANNVELKSYKDALDIYQKIDTLESVQIVFLRDNQEMEIVYEIR